MAALAFIQQIQSYYSASPSLSSASIGVALPRLTADLPNISLALNNLQIPSIGLGQHTEVVSGALGVETVIDLAQPILESADGSVTLITADRLLATLLHGGLVDQDGTDTPLQASDIQVSINEVPLVLNQTSPSPGQFAVSAINGQVQFGEALPASGTLRVSYFIGQWQRIIQQLSGELRLQIMSANLAEAENLSNDVVSLSTNAAEQIGGLSSLHLNQLSEINNQSFDNGVAYYRTAVWHFMFENIINQPESSGGIIQSIVLRTRRDSFPFEEENIT